MLMFAVSPSREGANCDKATAMPCRHEDGELKKICAVQGKHAANAAARRLSWFQTSAMLLPPESTEISQSLQKVDVQE